MANKAISSIKATKVKENSINKIIAKQILGKIIMLERRRSRSTNCWQLIRSIEEKTSAKQCFPLRKINKKSTKYQQQS